MLSHFESGPRLAVTPFRFLLGSCETLRMVGLAFSRFDRSIVGWVAKLGKIGARNARGTWRICTCKATGRVRREITTRLPGSRRLEEMGCHFLVLTDRMLSNRSRFDEELAHLLIMLCRWGAQSGGASLIGAIHSKAHQKCRRLTAFCI